MRSFNKWLMDKILLVLTAEEGYTADSSSVTQDAVTSIVTDSFGFRHEIKIRALGRISDNLEGVHEFNRETAGMDFTAPDLKV